MLAGLGAHRGDVGLHPRHLALHLGHVAVHRVDRGIGGEGRPGEQHEGGQGGGLLDAGSDREAAQALAVMKENIAWFEQIAELRGEAGVGRRNKISHYLPRSARNGPARPPMATARYKVWAFAPLVTSEVPTPNVWPENVKQFRPGQPLRRIRGTDRLHRALSR
jgi:hypothetical protein